MGKYRVIYRKITEYSVTIDAESMLGFTNKLADFLADMSYSEYYGDNNVQISEKEEASWEKI